MTINELLALAGMTASDEIPVWDAEGQANGRTKKITAENLAASIKTIASLIASTELDASPTEGSTNAVQSGGVYDAIQQSTANLKIVMVDKRVTIASGTGSITTAVIDLSEYIPTGKHIHTLADVALGNYSLPYVGDDGTTMTFLWQTNEKNIEIKNKSTAWTNYRIRAVLFLADD